MAESGTTVAQRVGNGRRCDVSPVCAAMSIHDADADGQGPFASLLTDWVVASRGYDALSCLSALERSGHRPDAIADRLIPHAARALGQAWIEDRLDFAAVTIGAARLQHMLGLLVDRTCGADPGAPRVLLVSPSGDDHTLGWKLVGLQLLRRGMAVIAMPDSGPGAAAQACDGIDLVLVSTSQRAGLRRASAIAARLGRHGPPVVAGGLVVDLDRPALPAGLAAVTNDLSWAVSLAWRGARARRSLA